MVRRARMAGRLGAVLAATTLVTSLVTAAAHAEPAATAATSGTFAGYEYAVMSSTRAGPWDVTTTIRLPRLACTSKQRGFAATANLYTKRSGGAKPVYDQAGVFIGCVHGTARYSPGLVVNESRLAGVGATFHAGDLVNLSVRASRSAVVVTVDDESRHVVRRHSAPGEPTAGYASVGDYVRYTQATGDLGVPRFGRLAYSHTLIDGKPIGAFTRAEIRYQWTNKRHQQVVSTGRLSRTGRGFSTEYRRP